MMNETLLQHRILNVYKHTNHLTQSGRFKNFFCVELSSFSMFMQMCESYDL